MSVKYAWFSNYFLRANVALNNVIWMWLFYFRKHSSPGVEHASRP